MAGFGGFDFANPSQFGDWAQYAGLNRKTGEMEDFGGAQQGVKPPEDLQAYMTQRLSPIQNKVAAVAPALQQMGQGNIVKAVGTMRTGVNLAAQPQIAPSPAYDYETGLD